MSGKAEWTNERLLFQIAVSGLEGVRCTHEAWRVKAMTPDQAAELAAHFREGLAAAEELHRRAVMANSK